MPLKVTKNEPHHGRVLAADSDGLQRHSDGGLVHSYPQPPLARARQSISHWLFVAVPWAWCADVPICALFAIWHLSN